MERRSFLKALGAIAAGFALDQTTGLIVPHKKIWQVGANAPLRGRCEHVVMLDETAFFNGNVSSYGPMTVQLPATNDGSNGITLIDRDGKEFKYVAQDKDGVVEVTKNDEVLEAKHFTLKFSNLVWAVSPEVVHG